MMVRGIIRTHRRPYAVTLLRLRRKPLRRPVRWWPACPAGFRSAVTLPLFEDRLHGGVHRRGFLLQAEAVFEHRGHRCRWRPADWPCSGPRCRAPSRAPARTSPTHAPEGLRSPIDADGSMPMDPASTAPSSLRMSPNMFSVSTTSKRRGLRTSCMAQLSTSMCSSATSGNSARHFDHHLAPELRVLEHVRLVHARDLLAAAARQVERHARDALDLRARVGHRVDRRARRAVAARCRAACRSRCRRSARGR